MGARLSVEEYVGEAHVSLAIFAAAGLDYDQITRQLQEEGVQHFVASFQTLFARIERERPAEK
jgi:transaldolase